LGVIDIGEYILLYREFNFYILYMLYRLTIYIPLIIINKEGVTRMLKRKYQRDEESDDDISIYSKSVRESLLDDDELSPMEEAFMNGYEDAV